jgi:hypothetical protein
MFRYPTWLLFTMLLSVGTSATALEPQEVSDRFWTALRNRDRAALLETVDSASRAALPMPAGLPAVGTATIVRTVIEADTARAEASVAAVDPGGRPASVLTLLRRENGGWKVEYAPTVAQLAGGSDLAAGVRDLRSLSGEMNRRIDTVLQELERELPEVEKDFDELKRELETRLPELQDRLEEFSRRLEESLNDPTARRDRGNSI